MGRTSDTRELTRHAANRLVAEGLNPSAVTVDRIYDEIRQGSRTTINDELKAWKDEQHRRDVLAGRLPPEVHDAMTKLWSLAVEHGAQKFDDRRRAMETTVDELRTANVQLDASLAQERSAHATARGQLDALANANNGLREQLAAAHATAAAAQRRIAELESQIARERAEAEESLALARTTHAEQQRAWERKFADQEKLFKDEVTKTTERLEGVQRHVMLQVAEARDQTKRVEAELTEAKLRGDRLSSEVLERSTVVSRLTAELNAAKDKQEQSNVQLADASKKREALVQQVGTLESELRLAQQQLNNMTSVARAAEMRLDAALRLSPKSKGAKGDVK